MIAGELKSKIDNLWETFATGGLTNPLNVIEQITYLMFIKDLDDSDNRRRKDNAFLGLNDYKSIFDGEVQIDDDVVVDGFELGDNVIQTFACQELGWVWWRWSCHEQIKVFVYTRRQNLFLNVFHCRMAVHQKIGDAMMMVVNFKQFCQSWLANV